MAACHCEFGTYGIIEVRCKPLGGGEVPPEQPQQLVNAANALTTPTYDGSGQVIHPDIYDAGAGNTWNGYRYWLAITPFFHGDDDYENPSILASTDGNTWVVPAGLTNPIEAFPTGDGNYNSDPEIVVVSGTMYLYYRQTLGTSCTVYYRTSTDGVTWSDRTAVLTGSHIQFVSPTIIHNGSEYRMYFGDQTTGYTLKYRTSAAITGPWANETTCTYTIPGGSNFYHFNACFDDGTYRMFVTAETIDRKNPLYFATSSDGLAWTAQEAPLLRPGVSGKWDDAELYRTAAIRTATGYDIWYSGQHAGQWHIGRTSMTI